MKIHLKRLICLLLCIATTFSLTSCEIVDYVSEWFEEDVDEDDKNDNDLQISQPTFPEGYTGGISMEKHFYDCCVIVWFETYDELMEAFELMRANGTEIPRMPYFDCEEYGMDVKFRISFPRSADDKLQEGQNFFDRRLDNLNLYVYVFFEDVTIEELEYSYFNRYLGFEIKERGEFREAKAFDNVKIYDDNGDGKYYVRYGGEVQFSLKLNNTNVTLSEEQIEILKNCIKVIQ